MVKINEDEIESSRKSDNESHLLIIDVHIENSDEQNNHEIEENDNNRNTINDDGGASGSGSRSGASGSSDRDDDSHLNNYPEDDDSKDNYDMDDEEIVQEEPEYDDDNVNETELFIVSKGQLNDLEDCDYFSDGDGIDDEREDILKCVNGEGLICKLFTGLYFYLSLNEKKKHFFLPNSINSARLH